MQIQVHEAIEAEAAQCRDLQRDPLGDVADGVAALSP